MIQMWIIVIQKDSKAIQKDSKVIKIWFKNDSNPTNFSYLILIIDKLVQFHNNSSIKVNITYHIALDEELA